jgi:hypothetical protein
MAKRITPDIRWAAQTALDVSGAVNLSGVLHSLNEILSLVLWPEARKLGKGTEYVNTHPIVTLFLHKLVSLNHSECFCSACIANFTHASAEVNAITKGVQP